MPLPPGAMAAPNGAAMARRLESVISVLMFVAALRVGVILKVSPAAAVPPLSFNEKPSITGGGVVRVLKAPMDVPSGRRCTV